VLDGDTVYVQSANTRRKPGIAFVEDGGALVSLLLLGKIAETLSHGCALALPRESALFIPIEVSPVESKENSGVRVASAPHSNSNSES
jgi:hypothetical protein